MIMMIMMMMMMMKITTIIETLKRNLLIISINYSKQFGNTVHGQLLDTINLQYPARLGLYSFGYQTSTWVSAGNGWAEQKERKKGKL